MKRTFSVLLSLAIAIAAGMLFRARAQDASPEPVYRNPRAPVEQRVADLLRRMTLDEKVAMLAGAGWMESMPNQRLGIPSIKMSDGPLGVRSWAGTSAETSKAKTSVETTSFPAGAAMAATWDPALVRREGRVIGEEVKAFGRDMILGPTVNIARQPLWGRNFEGYGEDPYLAGRLAVGYIQGVQSQGVIATVKHFDANNQEFERHRIDETISERALHEIYFPAFKAAVQQGGVWAVMSAYNKVNGLYCAENPYLLRDTLDKAWRFQGFVISDWGSTYSTAPTVNAGMDLEMPGGQPMRVWLARPATQRDGNGDGWLTPSKLQAAVKAGKISEATIDNNAGRILRVIFESGIFDHQHVATDIVDTPAQRAVARAAATESIVLLKNEGDLLPLSASKIHSIAVIGPNAAVARTGGGGSSLVRPKYAIAPFDGIRERAGSGIEVSYGLGAAMEGGNEGGNSPAEREKARAEAAALAAKADVAVVVVGNAPWIESEGHDRKSMELPAGQDELIEAVAKANKNTIVVINAGSPVAMPWVDHVPAILDMWYGGQEGGHGIAAVLFGDANPSAKLPVTFPKSWKDSPAYGHYPGTNLHVDYAEGIYVGYRWFDTRHVEPLFPFGYGLSYTKFAYSDLDVTPAKVTPDEPVHVSLRVRNTGPRAGTEIVELYVHDVESSIDRPEQELKGFERVSLAPGESKIVRMTLDKSALSFWSPATKGWVAEPGAFEVRVGASSRDIRLRASFDLVQ
jgi:beta-glucosidase